MIFGGVGAGLYGMLMYAILAVFIAGLMVGRTPEYIGQEDRAEGSQDGDAGRDRHRLQHPGVHCDLSSVMPFAAKTATGTPSRRRPPRNLNNSGAARLLARFCTPTPARTGNNGSAFAGINANTPWYNLTLGLAMLIGRFLFIIPLLAAAGSLAAKKQSARHQRNLPDARPAVCGPAGGHRGDRRRADLISRRFRWVRSSSTF